MRSFDYQCLLPLLEVRYEPNFLNFAEFLKPFIVNSSAKYHHLLMDRRKVIRKWKMVTDFQVKLKKTIILTALLIVSEEYDWYYTNQKN